MGAIQGFPVDVVKAQTVDLCPNAEWVLEGYVLENERVWEPKRQKNWGVRAWLCCTGMGKVQVMPIVHRGIRTYGDSRRRITQSFTPHFGAFRYEAPFMCAAVYELCDRMAPGFVKDVASWLALTLWGGLVVQVKKQRRSDEGMQRNLLTAIGLISWYASDHYGR